tara:strand:- start:1130 stop:2761 length:1632 start_codon:yes stop_codon:yes gene_type:complete
MNIIDTNNFSSIEYKPGEIYRYKATEIFDLLTEDLDYMYLSIDSKCSNCLVSITDFKYVYLNLYQFKYPNRWGESWDDIEPIQSHIPGQGYDKIVNSINDMLCYNCYDNISIDSRACCSFCDYDNYFPKNKYTEYEILGNTKFRISKNYIKVLYNRKNDTDLQRGLSGNLMRHLSSRAYIHIPNIDYICHECTFHSYYKCRECQYSYTMILDKEDYTGGLNTRDEIKLLCTDNISADSGGCVSCTIRYKSSFDRPVKMVDKEDYLHSTTFDKTASDRHIGIETELISPEYMNECDDNHPREILRQPRLWQIVTDTSLNQGGVEYKTHSPINGDYIDIALGTMKRATINNDLYPDESCGLHIHFNAIDMNVKAIKWLLLITRQIEPVLYKTLPRDRDTNSYAKPMPNIPIESIDRIISHRDLINLYYKDIANTQFSTDKYNGARYQGLNLHTRFYYGTVEFRYHEGCTDYIMIKKYIDFCTEIINASVLMSKCIINNNELIYRQKLLRDLFLREKTNSNNLEVISAIAGDRGLEWINERLEYNH